MSAEAPVAGRFFNAFGPRETNPHLIPEIAAQINAGQRTLLLGNQAPKRDFIHTSDRTRAVIALLQGVVKNPSGEARRKEKPEFARSK